MSEFPTMTWELVVLMKRKFYDTDKTNRVKNIVDANKCYKFVCVR